MSDPNAKPLGTKENSSNCSNNNDGSDEPDRKRLKSSTTTANASTRTDGAAIATATATATTATKKQTTLASFFTNSSSSSTTTSTKTKKTMETTVATTSTAAAAAADDIATREEKTMTIDQNEEKKAQRALSPLQEETEQPQTAGPTLATKKNDEMDIQDNNNGKPTAAANHTAATTTTTTTTDAATISPPSPPMIPELVPTGKVRFPAVWESHYDLHVLLRKVKGKHGSSSNTSTNPSSPLKIAAFDLDGTLMVWTIGNGMWPSRLEHYEIWSSTTVIHKLQTLYDEQGYQLLIVSNQGGVQKAHTGKKASLVKSVIDWIAWKVDRPIQAVISTRTLKKCPDTSYHKPTPKLWHVAHQLLFSSKGSGGGGGSSSKKASSFFSKPVPSTAAKEPKPKAPTIDLTQSFFVGDSADADDDQGGVDRKFAENVGISFWTPEEYFGLSDHERRQRFTSHGGGTTAESPPPASALHTRAALMGGYLQGPIMLVLCGVQGAGKSSFAQHVVVGEETVVGGITTTNDDCHNQPWIHLSQDTINNGKPGKREKVEAEVLQALKRGQSVLVDRMHLTPDQRNHFYEIAKNCKVPAHVVLLHPPKDIVTQRVRQRTNHPGKVEGTKGAQMTVQSLSNLIVPAYGECDDEDDKKDDNNSHNDDVNNTDHGRGAVPQLISCTSTRVGASQLAGWYRGVVPSGDLKSPLKTNAAHPSISQKVIVLKESPKDPTTSIDTTSNDENGVVENKVVTMPRIILGTMGIGKRIAKDVIATAHRLGFRGLDTAPTYKNEDRIGEALQDLMRHKRGNNDKLFCIVKIPKKVTQPDQVKDELTNSLKQLQLSQADLLLLHWPCDVLQAGTLSDVWRAMEECHKEGLCRTLGVCNFNAAALSQLLSTCTIRPVVNQVERHPLLPQWDLVDYCARQDIVLQAHTPLGQGKADLLEHNVVVEIAKEMSSSMTPAQVVLLWNLQQGLPVVPKCSSPEHAREILQLVDPMGEVRSTMQQLSPDQMKRLNEITAGTTNGETRSETRFVKAPFMYGSAEYCWGKRMPTSKK